MSDRALQNDTEQWHRFFAVECNNRAWRLTSKPDRSDNETREMLDAAHAAAFHWGKVGTGLHHARADLLLAHAQALVGLGPQAMASAKRALAYYEGHPHEDWDMAFAYLELAMAAWAMGHAAQHAAYHDRAKALGAAIREDEERAVFEDEFSRVPSPLIG